MTSVETYGFSWLLSFFLVWLLDSHYGPTRRLFLTSMWLDFAPDVLLMSFLVRGWVLLPPVVLGAVFRPYSYLVVFLGSVYIEENFGWVYFAALHPMTGEMVTGFFYLDYLEWAFSYCCWFCLPLVVDSLPNTTWVEFLVLLVFFLVVLHPFLWIWCHLCTVIWTNPFCWFPIQLGSAFFLFFQVLDVDSYLLFFGPTQLGAFFGWHWSLVPSLAASSFFFSCFCSWWLSTHHILKGMVVNFG